MSTATNRLRRAGVGGVAAAVAIGTLATGGTAFAAAGDYTSSGQPKVTQGASAQAAGDLTLEFANSFLTNASQAFTIASNDCTTAPGQDAAIGLTADPLVTLAGPFNGTAAGDPTSTKPTYTVTTSSSSAACATANVKDVVTVKLTKPSVGKSGDTFKLALSNIKYNVGASAPVGKVAVKTSGDLLATGTVDNAIVTNASYTFIPVIAAQETSTGNVLGTAKFVETTAGAYFKAGDTDVTLTLSAGKFTPDVTPSIAVPNGYTVKTKPATTASTTYTFTVTAPAAPSKATVTVSGLKFDAAAVAETVTMDANIAPAAPGTPVPPQGLQGAMDAVNVLSFNDRTGGADRYATAAALFTGEFPSNSNVVLSGGGLYPDALSANYLAGKIGTGTLLTGANTLASAARQAIITAGVRTVYITGGTGAVSANVENDIKSMHVANNPNDSFINVIRLGGQDRYKTNMIINEYNFTANDTVLMASGKGFADALSLGPIAYAQQYPLILTNGSSLGASETTQLNDFNPSNVVIAGGLGVVSQAVEDSLKAKGYNVLRLAGQDRTQTAAAVATWASTGVVGSTNPIAVSQGFTSTTVYVTTGQMFADALSAGPVAGSNFSVIMPGASSTNLGIGLAQYLGTKTVGSVANGKQVDTLWALGLTGATSYGLLKAAAASIGQ